MDDLASRIDHRIQLTTDGHGAYLEAVDAAFGGAIDYTMLIKKYGNPTDGHRSAEARYSPGKVKGKQAQTPAQAAGVAKHRMRYRDIVDMIDADYEERRRKTRGPYRKRSAA